MTVNGPLPGSLNLWSGSPVSYKIFCGGGLFGGDNLELRWPTVYKTAWAKYKFDHLPLRGQCRFPAKAMPTQLRKSLPTCLVEHLWHQWHYASSQNKNKKYPSLLNVSDISDSVTRWSSPLELLHSDVCRYIIAALKITMDKTIRYESGQTKTRKSPEIHLSALTGNILIILLGSLL